MIRFLKKFKSLIISIINRFKKKIPVLIPVYHNSLLTGRVALVTGGTSGIGYAIAKSFLNSGAFVVITGRNEERVKLIAKKLEDIDEKFTGMIHGIALDSTDIASFKGKLESLDSLIGDRKIDVLVNNSGVMNGGDYFKVTLEEYEEVLDTNLKGLYFLTKAISMEMIKNNVKGNILNIASSSSIRPAISPYALSKWGVRGFTLGLAKTLAPHEIVVNGLAPGPTVTPLLFSDKNSGIERTAIPSQRYVTADEVANFAVILVSPISRMIIGDTVYMTGGAGNLTIDDINYNSINN